jgi:DNA-binding NarL/FixJ family response regulator
MRDRADEETHEAIFVIDAESFSRECVVEALRGFFPDAAIIGISSVDSVYRPDGIIALVLMKAKARISACEGIASDVKTVNRYFPKTPIVLISVDDDEVDVLEAIAAGVQGVVPVTAPLRIGVAAFRLVMAGGTYFPHPLQNHLPAPSPTMGNGHADTISPQGSPILPALMAPGDETNRVTDSLPLHPANSVHVAFTDREADVLAPLQKGHSNKWIADHLKISENTVKVHIRNIMRKLHATNRTEAVVRSHSEPNNL